MVDVYVSNAIYITLGSLKIIQNVII